MADPTLTKHQMRELRHTNHAGCMVPKPCSICIESKNPGSIESCDPVCIESWDPVRIYVSLNVSVNFTFYISLLLFSLLSVCCSYIFEKFLFWGGFAERKKKAKALP